MKTIILLVHFGTANKKAIKNAIYTLENEVKEQVGNQYEVRNCFMLKRICTILKEKDDINIEHFVDVLENIKKEGFENIIIQPAYFMIGDESKRIELIMNNYIDDFKSIKIGNPLIYGQKETLDKTCDKVLSAILKNTEDSSNKLFIGHGSTKHSNKEYRVFEERLKVLYKENIIVGTLAGENNLEYTVEEIKKQKIDKLQINLLFMLIGKHVKNDIIKGENSWCNTIKNLGIDVEVVEKSLLEYKEVRDIFIARIKDIISK